MNEILEIKDLEKVYKDGTEALKSINLEVKEGTIFGLLGPNGAGKSTLISIITTLLSKTKGKVYLDGLDLDTKANQIRSKIGVTFQENIKENNLTGYEILKNHALLYGMSSNKIKLKIEELLELIDLKEIANKKIEKYSGGMLRRLEIVKGIITEPKILFLDEPTLGLDPKSRNEIWSFIRKLKEDGTTVFVTSHYLEEIEKHADEIAIINNGRIIEKGSPTILRKKYNEMDKSRYDSLEDIFLCLTESKREEN